jgi:hypothetical protein
MSWIITGTQRYQPAALLDQFPGAAAAYSLRNLVGTSNPAVVRVRRDSDNAEQDFTATEVSNGTLAAWVGAGNNGLVRTWYDQSENGYHASQTVLARQPKIVNLGALITESGQAAIKSDSIDSIYALITEASLNISIGNVAAFSVQAQYQSEHADRYFTINNQITFLQSSPSALPPVNRYFGNIIAVENASADFKLNTQQLFSLVANNAIASSSLYQNGNLVGNSSGSPVSSSIVNGQICLFNRLELNQGANQSLQELVLYFSDQSANRTGIEANINAHYSIF